MAEGLRLNPQTIEEIVAICDTMLETLREAGRQAGELTAAPSFGGFKSAEDLRAGFVRKAQGTPESLYEILKQFEAVLRGMRDTFATGGEGFLAAESERVERLHDLPQDEL
ncbi:MULTISPECIES: hypothetical protein [unclassified Rhodococcus (in: high G+C Gram-positive bacteria)]|uniref:hypothetical protein n=1 Tax=unclassified Rhodococcus (in: high G+C Gram-positive bacteria) TaxID=192944 RepID=UPI0009261244|nr:hypothetical protein [Rhodococcus sp. M8]OLL18338.1 hypothetical protein BKE56_017575 [Rhodococcus sp. M8]QPG45397.1 hypothetical protein ISO16_26915 [Rhodococcus sp. M8]